MVGRIFIRDSAPEPLVEPSLPAAGEFGWGTAFAHWGDTFMAMAAARWTLERLEQEHDVVIAELFRELKQIGLSLREVAVEVRFALNKENKQ